MARIPKAKACPFCGSSRGFVECMTICVGRYWCDECAALGPPVEHGDYDGAGCQKMERDAIRAWNRRSRRATLTPNRTEGEL